jgi:hypothetical protein
MHDGGKVFEVSCEPYESLAIYQRHVTDDKAAATLLETRASAIAKAMASPSLVLVPRPSSSTITLETIRFILELKERANIHATSIDVAYDKSNFSHLGSESRYIGFNAIIHAQPGEKLMQDRKGGIRCGYAVSG